MTSYDHDLLEQAILHYKTKEFSVARRLFERVHDTAQDYNIRARASYYLGMMSNDPTEKRNYLEEVLVVDPTHPEARREMAILDGRLDPGDIFNPDAPAPQPAETVQAQADRFTCPKCGGRMTYAPDGRSLVCEYCNRPQPVVSQRPQEQDFLAAMATSKAHSKPVSTQVFHCQGCGAEFMLSAAEMTATCVFCGSAHVTRQQRDLSTPDSIIPMTVTQQAASQILVTWVEKNRIEPKGNAPVPRGFYLPVWTFDLLGSIPWNGFVYRDKKRVPVSGEEPVSLHSTRVPASKKLADLLPALMPGFNFSSAAAYNPSFLAGWAVQAYDVPLSDAAIKAREEVVSGIRARIFRDNGQVMDLVYKTTGISISAFNLVLLPLWLAEVTVVDGTLRVVVNGATGAVHGDTSKRSLGSLFKNLVDRK